jgi:hypothetical protein
MRYLSKKILREKVKMIVDQTFSNSADRHSAHLCVLRAMESIMAEERKKFCSDEPTIRMGRKPHKQYRPIIISALFRAWRMGTGEMATVSKRLPGQSSHNSFVQFSRGTLAILGIANVIDNLDEFRSMGNALERNSWTCQCN